LKHSTFEDETTHIKLFNTAGKPLDISEFSVDIGQ